MYFLLHARVLLGFVVVGEVRDREGHSGLGLESEELGLVLVDFVRERGQSNMLPRG